MTPCAISVAAIGTPHGNCLGRRRQLACAHAGSRRLRRQPYERAAAVHGLDQAALAQLLHRPPDGVVPDAVFVSELQFGQQSITRPQVTGPDATLDEVGDLDIEITRTLIVDLRVDHELLRVFLLWHRSTVELSRSSQRCGELCIAMVADQRDHTHSTDGDGGAAVTPSLGTRAAVTLGQGPRRTRSTAAPGSGTG